MLSWYAMVLIYLNIILLVVTSGPIPPADTVNLCFAGLTVILPLIVRLALTLAQIQCSAKSESLVFPETSDEFSRSHVI